MKVASRQHTQPLNTFDASEQDCHIRLMAFRARLVIIDVETQDGTIHHEMPLPALAHLLFQAVGERLPYEKR